MEMSESTMKCFTHNSYQSQSLAKLPDREQADVIDKFMYEL